MKNAIVMAVIVAIALAGFGVWYFMNFPATYSGTPEPITIGNLPSEYAALIYIAEDQGYFSRNGLNVLDQAEKYIIEHPDEAKATIQIRMNYTDAYMATTWLNNQFSLTLDRSLMIAMNDEGRWMINNNLTSEKTLPYFRDYIYTKGMEEVKPEAVNIR